jgi:[ribosomal protein S18]-alanine N-acetyltransferase
VSWQDARMLLRHLGPGDAPKVVAAADLFDDDARPDATRRFLEDGNHHLIVAYEDEIAAGFVSGVEMTHPDKGTEMFLYELGVDERFRRRGVGTALVDALAELARDRGCYGMWVLTDADNDAALATYTRSGATERSDHVMLSWTFSTDGEAQHEEH